MPTDPGKIIWTEIDEAPALATYSLLPIIRKFTGGTGITIETARHLPGRENPRQLPGEPDRGPAGAGLAERSSASWPSGPRPTSSSCRTSARRSRSSRPRFEELQGQGYQVPDYPGESGEPGGAGDQDALREGARERREPGAAGRQLRPASRRRGEGIREEASAQAGSVDAGLEGARRHHEPRRLRDQREVGDRPRRDHRADQSSPTQKGAVTVLKDDDRAQGRRGDRRHAS